MKTEQINYKGFTIEIVHDECPENPFENWDCEPGLIAYYDRAEADHSKGEIDNYLMDFLTGGQIRYHQKRILDLVDVSIDDFNLDYPLGEYTGDERNDQISQLLCDFIIQNNESRAAFCELFNIPHYHGTSRGYCQSSWADVFICITPEDQKRCGYNKDRYPEIMKGTFKLYGDWAWGNVYGFKTKDSEGNDIDSCFGFYGDYEESGLLDTAKGSIDYEIDSRIKSRNNQLKTLLQNHVPLNKRAELLTA